MIVDGSVVIHSEIDLLEDLWCFFLALLEGTVVSAHQVQGIDDICFDDLSQKLACLPLRESITQLGEVLLKIDDESMETTAQSRNHLINIWSICHKLDYNSKFVKTLLGKWKVLRNEASSVVEDGCSGLWVIAEYLAILLHVEDDDTKDRFLEVFEARLVLVDCLNPSFVMSIKTRWKGPRRSKN